jgi:hypothetical protein
MLIWRPTWNIIFFKFANSREPHWWRGLYHVEPLECCNQGFKSRKGHNRCRRYILCFPVHTEDLQWRVTPSEESYEMLKGFFVSEITLNQEMLENLGRETRMIRRSPKVDSVLRLMQPSLHIRERWFAYLHCSHPVVYHDWWYLAVNKTIKINQSNCSHWFYLIVVICFDPHLGSSSRSLIKYVSYYWTVVIWIHISATGL